MSGKKKSGFKKKNDELFGINDIDSGPRFKLSKKLSISLGVIIVLMISFVFLFFSTGFLQMNSIDKRDLAVWDYSDEGVMVGAEEFFIEGNKDVCWVLVHGYVSTPAEFRGLAGNISNNFGDYVYVPRLKGHGELPSHVLNLSLDDWYEQIEIVYNNLEDECGEINFVGSSFGGALSLRVAEDYDIGRLYLLDSYLNPTYRKKWILPLNLVIDYTSSIFNYIKKGKSIAQINNPEGISNYLTYYNFPLTPVKNSRGFLDETRLRVKEVDEPTLIIHSPGDQTASYEEMRDVYFELDVEKEFFSTNKSNHIILLDYDNQEAINKILEFEEAKR
jgi:carboxylesterase